MIAQLAKAIKDVFLKDDNWPVLRHAAVEYIISGNNGAELWNEDLESLHELANVDSQDAWTLALELIIFWELETRVHHGVYTDS